MPIRTAFVVALAFAGACSAPRADDSMAPCCTPTDSNASTAGAGAAAAGGAATAMKSDVPAWTAVKLTRDDWHAEGTMADACQCIVFCPCEFRSLPSGGNCDDAALLHIDKGHFGGVALDHLDIVVASSSPAGKRMVDNVGNLTFGRIYVSKEASDAQAAVAAELARRFLGTFVKDKNRISPDERTIRVPLSATVDAGKATAKIPGILDLDMETLKGGDEGRPIEIVNSPWAAPGIGNARVGHSLKYDYTAEGRNWHYAGRSASFRDFKMDGKVAAAPQ